jgi:hypothetical protein
MRRSIVLPVALGLLVLVVSACTGAATQSPSPSASAPAPTTDPSVPAASPSASVEPSASASAGAAVEVVADDYRFDNVPDTAAVGTAFTMRNDGAEAHEMVIARKNAGVTTSFEELLQMPEEESSKLVTFVGQVMANPGDTAPGELVADGPGDYLMICFFPQGWTEIPEGTPGPDASLPIGAPHFTLGMIEEFTVE